jgi:hypothetical protein
MRVDQSMAKPNNESRRNDKPDHRVLPAAAERALAEAAERRKALDKSNEKAAREINGRDGPDPTRYGDWEKKGLAIDF